MSLVSSLSVLALRFSWSWLLVSFAIYSVLLVFGVNIGLHRGLAHRLLSPQSIWFKISVCLGALSCLGKPIDWVLVHRLHHAYSDGPLDPHSPKEQGKWVVLFNFWQIPDLIQTGEKLRLVRDVVRDPTVRWFNRFYFHCIFALYFTLFMLCGWEKAVYLYSLPCVLCLGATSLVNTFCHSTKGGAKDNVLLAILTWGEGLHRRHHERPAQKDYSGGMFVDPTGKVLQRLCR